MSFQITAGTGNKLSWARTAAQESPTMAITIFYWAKTIGAGAASAGFLFSKYYNNDGSAPWSSYTCGFKAGDGYARIELGDTGNVYNSKDTTASPLGSEGVWYPIIAWYDGTSLVIRMAGTDYTASVASKTIKYYGSDPLELKAGPWSDIRVAEAAVWDVALDSTQLSDLISGANPLSIGTPVWYASLKTDSAEYFSAATATATNAAQNADHPTVDDPPVGSFDINAYAFELEGN